MNTGLSGLPPGRRRRPGLGSLVLAGFVGLFAAAPVRPSDPAGGPGSVVLIVTNVVVQDFAFRVAGWGAGTSEGSLNAPPGSATEFNFGQVVDSPAYTLSELSATEAQLLVFNGGISDNLPSIPLVTGRLPETITASESTVGLACGEFHTVLLRRDGSVVARGWNDVGQTDVPADLGVVAAVACGLDHTVALRADGTVRCWGWNLAGQCDVPADLGPAKAVAAGGRHTLVVRPDGTVTGWGANARGQIDPPAGLKDVVSLAAGAEHSLAVCADGTVRAWGGNTAGQCDVPADLHGVVAVAGGGFFSLALCGDGTVRAWGDGSAGQTNVPPSATNIVEIAAGNYHALALRADGAVIAWGDARYQSTAVPENLRDVVAIAAGGFHSEALVRTGATVRAGRVARGVGATDLAAPLKMRLDFNLPVNRRYVLETSADLRTWQPAGVISVVPGHFSEERVIEPGRAFFRVGARLP